jgi:hypothetical protein
LFLFSLLFFLLPPLFSADEMDSQYYFKIPNGGQAVGGFPPSQRALEEDFEKGLSLQHQGDYEEAIFVFKGIVNASSFGSRSVGGSAVLQKALQALAINHGITGQWSKVISDCRTLLERFGNDTKVAEFVFNLSNVAKQHVSQARERKREKEKDFFFFCLCADLMSFHPQLSDKVCSSGVCLKEVGLMKCSACGGASYCSRVIMAWNCWLFFAQGFSFFFFFFFSFHTTNCSAASHSIGCNTRRSAEWPTIATRCRGWSGRRTEPFPRTVKFVEPCVFARSFAALELNPPILLLTGNHSFACALIFEFTSV